MIDDIRCQLCVLGEEEYKRFNQKLLPGVDNLIGVRLPVLRKLAKKISKEDFRSYLNETEKMSEKDSFYEERMLEGLVLGYADMDLEERREYLKIYVSKINNWGVCDSCVTGYKFMEKDSDYWFDFVKTYRNSTREFELRFMVVSMMSHFAHDRYIDEILEICAEIKNDGYYCRMGVAWAIQAFYVKYPDKIRKLLKSGKLDTFTHNKSIQKIRESYRVSRDEKEELNKWKRR